MPLRSAYRPTRAGDASGWNWTPSAEPTRIACTGYRAEAARWTAPGGRRVTASSCMAYW